MSPDRPTVLDERVTTGIAITITAVWAISFVADIIIEGYDPSPFIHALMMTVAGAAFGHRLIRAGGNNGKKDDAPARPEIDDDRWSHMG